MKLIFASNNAHKLAEVRAILSDHEVLSLHDVGFEQEIEETGETLEANSLIKAQTVSTWLQQHNLQFWVFADDTGLEISALGGKPGVYTARWAGEPSNPANNRHKALVELAGKTNRTARFRTVITLIKEGEVTQVEGIVNGSIAFEEHGEGGFGYDPIFIPTGHEQTFAQLPAEIKNSISHRARAMAALKQIL
ncbi:MAG: RdgB/HAM1 family non-canonical purine NTP pyrophosphatase [Paludibacteraceae bacterium]|nr:RdgB/HAM1 family non-canonical purine NTP pyrophosphatase [Paludibacteraceae bacterium]